MTHTTAQILAEARRLIEGDGNRMTAEREALGEELFVAGLKEVRTRRHGRRQPHHTQAS